MTNLVNGKMYVGQTTRGLAKRWAVHLQYVHAGAQTALHRAIRKYGADQFLIEPVCSVPVAHLDDYERKFIKAFRSSSDSEGYNLTFGGDGGVPTKLTRQRMRRAAKARAATLEGRTNLSKAFRLSQTEAARAKMRASVTQVCRSKEFRQRRSALTAAQFASVEARAKVSKFQKNYAKLPAVRARLRAQGQLAWTNPTSRAALLNARRTQCTEEVRAKLRMAWVRRKAPKTSNFPAACTGAAPSGS